MAFQKAITTASNVSGNYWRIDDLALPKGSARVAIMNLYKDSASAQPPVSSPMQLAQQYLIPESVITVTLMDAANSNCFKLAYEWIGANIPFYSDATSV